MRFEGSGTSRRHFALWGGSCNDLSGRLNRNWGLRKTARKSRKSTRSRFINDIGVDSDRRDKKIFVASLARNRERIVQGDLLAISSTRGFIIGKRQVSWLFVAIPLSD